MTRYVWRDDAFYNRATGKRMKAPDRIVTPSVQRDVSYVSPLSRKTITSRSQRREEMKIHGVREVDPSEYKPVYRSKKRADQMRADHDPKAGMPDYGDAAPFERLAKSDLPCESCKDGDTMTREETKAAIREAGGIPSDSAWIKYHIPERPSVYCSFLSRHYSEMTADEAMAEVTAYRKRATSVIAEPSNRG